MLLRIPTRTLRRPLRKVLYLTSIILLLGAAGVAVRSITAQMDRAATCPPCYSSQQADENFDNVTPPALPTGWLATNTLGPPPLWVTSNSGVPKPPANTLPNSALIDDPAVLSDKRLDSLSINFSGCCGQLTFRHNFSLEASEIDPTAGFDGGVLEIRTDGGNTFQDILAAGGSFGMGGYNRTIAADRGSPIAGRQAWSGNSQGFVTTVVNVPGLAAPYLVPVGGVSSTDAAAAAPDAGTTPSAVRTAKPSRYARVYSGTSPKPLIAGEAEL